MLIKVRERAHRLLVSTISGIPKAELFSRNHEILENREFAFQIVGATAKAQDSPGYPSELYAGRNSPTSWIVSHGSR